MPEDLERLRERLEVPRERDGVLDALVSGQVGRPTLRAPHARLDSARLHAEDGARTSAELQRLGADVRRRPLRLGHPPPLPHLVESLRRRRVLHPGAEHRLVHDPRVDALQPVVPPAHALLEEADARPGKRVVGERVRPRADEALARNGESFKHPRHRVRVAVDPAADRVDGDVDRGVVLADRAVLPVGVAPLVPEPGLDPVIRTFEPFEPGLVPPVAVEPRIGRARVPDQHRGGPVEHVERLDASPAVMDVVGVAVVCRHQRHDRLEPGRAERGELEGVEPAPRDAPHSEVAVAPRLLAKPGHHLEAVRVLLLRVLVRDEAVRLAGAAHVDPHRRVAEPRDVRLPARIANRGPVHLAVREELEDRGDRICLGILRQPDAGRQAAAVGQRQPGVFDLPERARKLGPGRHRPDPLMRRDRIAR